MIQTAHMRVAHIIDIVLAQASISLNVVLSITNLVLVKSLSNMLSKILVLLVLLLVVVAVLGSRRLATLMGLPVNRVNRLGIASVGSVRSNGLDRSSSLELCGLLGPAKVVIVIQEVLRSSTRSLGRSRQSARNSNVVNELGDKRSPAVLMLGSKASASVGLEELVEENIVLKVGVKVELVIVTVEGSLSSLILSKDVNETMLNLLSNLGKVHVVAGASGALDLETVSVVQVVSLEGLNEQKGGREPNGTSPVGVTAKHGRVGIARDVVDSVSLAMDIHGVRMVLVELGQRSNTVFGQELVLVKHLLKNLDKSLLVHQRQKKSLTLTSLGHGSNVSTHNLTSVLDKPGQTLCEGAKSVENLGLQSDGSKQGNQTNQRSHGDLLGVGAAVRDGIVVEAISLVPQTMLGTVSTLEGHGICNEQEVLKELGSNVLVDESVLGKLKGNAQHVETEESHPSSSISLLQRSTSGERLGSVEETNVIQTKEASLEDVLTVEILSVDPPSEVEQQLLEDTLKEVNILSAIQLSLNLESSKSRPSMDGGVDVTKVPLVGGDLTVGMHVPLTGEQIKLLLGKFGVNHGKRDAVEGSIPSGKERVLPHIWH